MLTFLKYANPQSIKLQQSIPIAAPAGGYSVPGVAPIGVVLESRRLGDNADDISYILGNTWENIMQGGRSATHAIVDPILQEIGILDKPRATGVRVSTPQGQAVLDYQTGARYSPGTEAGMVYSPAANYLYGDPTAIGVMNFRKLEDIDKMTPEVKAKLADIWNKADTTKKEEMAKKRGTTIEEMDKKFNPPTSSTGGNEPPKDPTEEQQSNKKDPDRNKPWTSRFWVKKTDGRGIFNTGYRPTWQGLTTGIMTANYTIPAIIDGVSLGLQTATGSELHGPAAIPLRSSGTYLYHPKTGFWSNPNESESSNQPLQEYESKPDNELTLEELQKKYGN